MATQTQTSFLLRLPATWSACVRWTSFRWLGSRWQLGLQL